MSSEDIRRGASLADTKHREDLKKIFDESIGSTKAYFISKVQQKYPRLDKKDIEAWLKSQEVVQVNTKVKGINLKITAKPRTFQIDIMFYKIGQSLKPFLLLVDIMSRKAFCYSIPGEKNMNTRSQAKVMWSNTRSKS